MIAILKCITATTITIILIIVGLIVFLTKNGMSANDISMIIGSITEILYAWNKWMV